MKDRPAAFAELHRVLRPGGALVVSTDPPSSDWLRKGGSSFDRTLESDTWMSPTGQRQEVAQPGFLVLRLRGAT